MWIAQRGDDMADDFNVNQLLAENRAYLGKDNSRSLVSDKGLIRYWKMQPPKALEVCAAALRARRTETNPQADLKIFSGTWRIQDVAYTLDNRSGEGILYETLALGLATAIQEHAAAYDSAVSPDTEVRLVKVEVFPQLTSAALKMIRRWPYIDPTATNGLIETFKSKTSVTNPVASGQVYTGAFTIGKTWAEKADDGSDDIYQELSLNLFTSISMQYAANCKEDVLIVEQDGLSKTAVDALLVTYQRAAYSPGVYNSINVGYDKETGLYSFSVRQRIGVAKTQDQYDSYASAAQTAVTDKTFNATTATPLDMTRTAGQIVSGDVNLNDLCLYDKERKTVTAVDQTATDYEKNAARTVSKAKHTEGTAVGAPSAPSAGTLVKVVNEPTESGKTRTVVETTDVIDQTATTATASDAHIDSAAETVDVIEHTQAAAPLDDVVYAAPGTVVETASNPTESGKFATKISTTVAKDQTATGSGAHDAYADSAAATVSEESHTATSKQSDVTYATPGTLVSVKNQPRPDGLFKVDVETKVAKPQSASNASNATSKTVAETVATAASAQVTASAGAQGIVNEVDNVPREDGLFRTVARTITAVKQTVASHTSKIDAESTVATTKGENYYNADVSDIPAPTQANGHTKTYSKEIQADGTYRIVSNDETHNDLSDADPYTSYKAPEHTDTRQGFRNSSTEPTLTETYGSLVRQKNDNGTWDGDKVVRTYTGAARVQDMIDAGVIHNLKLESVVFFAPGFGSTPLVYIQRTDRKVTSLASSAATFADQVISGGSGTNPITGEKLGRVESAPNYGMYIAYSVTIFTGSSYDTFAEVEALTGPT